jgi:hypothetical protein
MNRGRAERAQKGMMVKEGMRKKVERLWRALVSTRAQVYEEKGSLRKIE